MIEPTLADYLRALAVSATIAALASGAPSVPTVAIGLATATGLGFAAGEPLETALARAAWQSAAVSGIWIAIMFSAIGAAL
jgi:hypothetical protein